MSYLPKLGRTFDEQLTVSIQKEYSKNKFYPAICVANKIGVSHTTVLDHITNIIFQHFLTEDQKKKQIKLVKILLNNLRGEEATGYEFVLTGDESWVFCHYQQKKIWILKWEDVPIVHKNELFLKKSKIAIFVSGKGVQIIDLKPFDIKITGEYFLKNILMTIEQSDIMIKSKRWNHKLCTHYNNAHNHCCNIVKKNTMKIQVT